MIVFNFELFIDSISLRWFLSSYIHPFAVLIGFRSMFDSRVGREKLDVYCEVIPEHIAQIPPSLTIFNNALKWKV